jgi:hypothetical protein
MNTVFWWIGAITSGVGAAWAVLFIGEVLIERCLRAARVYPHFLRFLWAWMHKKGLESAINQALNDLEEGKSLRFFPASDDSWDEYCYIRNKAIRHIAAHVAGVRKPYARIQGTEE